MVADDGDRVGHVEEHEAPDDRVERKVVPPGRDVALGEVHVRRACGRRTLDRHLDRGRGLVDGDDRALGPDQLGEHERHVTEAGAEIEHAHARRDARRAQEHLGGLGDRRSLMVEPRELRDVAAQHVCCGAHRGRGYRAAPGVSTRTSDGVGGIRTLETS